MQKTVGFLFLIFLVVGCRGGQKQNDQPTVNSEANQDVVQSQDVGNKTLNSKEDLPQIEEQGNSFTDLSASIASQSNGASEFQQAEEAQQELQPDTEYPTSKTDTDSGFSNTTSSDSSVHGSSNASADITSSKKPAIELDETPSDWGEPAKKEEMSLPSMTSKAEEKQEFAAEKENGRGQSSTEQQTEINKQQQLSKQRQQAEMKQQQLAEQKRMEMKKQQRLTEQKQAEMKQQQLAEQKRMEMKKQQQLAEQKRMEMAEKEKNRFWNSLVAKSGTYKYDILYKGEKKGTQTISIQKRGDKLIVKLDFNMDVSTWLYTYKVAHNSTEVWRDGIMQSYECSQDTNGDKSSVEINHSGSHKYSANINGKKQTLTKPTTSGLYWNLMEMYDEYPAFIVIDGTVNKTFNLSKKTRQDLSNKSIKVAGKTMNCERIKGNNSESWFSDGTFVRYIDSENSIDTILTSIQK